MPPIPSDPGFSPRRIREAADRAQILAAARAGYEGQVAIAVPEAVKRREYRRAEREREAYKRRYLGMTRKTR